MIESFKHRGLKPFLPSRRPQPSGRRYGKQGRTHPDAAEAADRAEALDLPGLAFHPLKGDLKGFYAVTVRANWRIIYRFENGTAYDVELIDYH